MTNSPPINIREVFEHSLRRFEKAYEGEFEKPLISDDDRAWLLDFYLGKYDGRYPVFRHDKRIQDYDKVTFAVICNAEYLILDLFDGYESQLLDSGFLILGISDSCIFLLHQSFSPYENKLMFSTLIPASLPSTSEITRESIQEMLEINDPAEYYGRNNIPWTLSLFRDIISKEPVDSSCYLYAEKRRRKLLIE